MGKSFLLVRHQRPNPHSSTTNTPFPPFLLPQKKVVERWGIPKKVRRPSRGDENQAKREWDQRWLDHAFSAVDILLTTPDLHLQYHTTGNKHFGSYLNPDKSDTTLTRCLILPQDIRIEITALEADLRRVHLPAPPLWSDVLHRFRPRPRTQE